MSDQFWAIAWVTLTFTLYIGIAFRSRASSTGEFYIAGRGVHPVLNGMATAADWMSAASFLSMAGLIAYLGYDGSVYLLGWTGGYVLLALLLAPWLREFGKFTVPEFVGDRYDSDIARLVAILCSLFISFVYVAGQMRGVGVAFAGFLGVSYEIGIAIGMLVVFFYAVLGGMKGITYTQVAQYCVMIFAYTVPAIFISLIITGNPVPQLGFIGHIQGEEISMLDKLSRVLIDLGFDSYTSGHKTLLDVCAITAALMFGTAGLPHVIIRFFTVPSAQAARLSAGWALVFIAVLYTTAPTVAAFARLNFTETINEAVYVGGEDYEQRAMQVTASGDKASPQWFHSWEETGLVSFEDHNGDGRMQIRGPAAADGIRNEVHADRDIFVLANPAIAQLPGWVIGLVIAGGLAAALSTAAGLLMVISSSISHDLCRRILFPRMKDSSELAIARLAAAAAVFASGLLGIYAAQLGVVAEVVAIAFGLAAASMFPPIVLGIFWTRTNRQGAIAAMLTGLTGTLGYIYHFKFGGGTQEQWLFGISPEGIGLVFMLLALAVGIGVSLLTPPPSEKIRQLVLNMRVPGQTRAAARAAARADN